MTCPAANFAKGSKFFRFKTSTFMESPPPLQGIRILAVEQFGAGPWSSMLLADLGAEVIKIENPLSRGDIGRHVASEIEGDDSVYFQSFNRNKKSITLNLNHPEAAEVLHPLVGRSDCVFNNLRGDLPARMGLDYSSLGRVKRSIVSAPPFPPSVAAAVGPPNPVTTT